MVKYIFLFQIKIYLNISLNFYNSNTSLKHQLIRLYLKLYFKTLQFKGKKKCQCCCQTDHFNKYSWEICDFDNLSSDLLTYLECQYYINDQESREMTIILTALMPPTFINRNNYKLENLHFFLISLHLTNIRINLSRVIW